MPQDEPDVIVVGAGNAGLSAAHAARERGCRVVVLEKADHVWSGGNSAFTAGAIRVAHGGLDDLRGILEGVDDDLAARTDLDPYTPDEFLADMRRVTLGRGDPAMAEILVRDSAPELRWLHERGLRFRLMYERQAYEVDGRHRFWGGLAVGTVDGGEGLMERHRAAAERSGIDLRHGIGVTDLVRDEDGVVRGVVARAGDGARAEMRARAVVLAAGGFEANPQLRAAYLGPNWDVAKVRGTPHNTGEVLVAALGHGAQAYGHDAGTLGDLADGLGVDRDGLERTVEAFNAATRAGAFDPSVKDALGTVGISPPKSNWALAIDTPPYVGFRITCGITFTFGGVRVDEQARVLDTGGRVIPGLTAAGELVGGLFFHNYPGGTGLTAGAVFGRRAGYAAAGWAAGR